MCGLTGIFGIRARREDALLTLQSMMDAISHRGPDGRGSLADNLAALGHVRLAILDIEGGSQPMQSPDGKLWLAYNGEIYNYKYLRNELVRSGYRFRTTSDTEALLAAWLEWGEDALSRLNGMFAFAIWDQRERKGLLVRDALGIKPLFYYKDGVRLLFGSEVKAILSALPEAVRLDLKSVHLLMNFRYLPGDRTMWTGIRQLAPGSMLVWKDGDIRITSWVKPLPEPVEKDPAHAREVLADLLRRSVHGQLMSDVPIGGYLSSGIDSGLLTAVATSRGGIDCSRYPTFTIRTGDSPDEARGAARTAGLLSVRNFQEDVALNIEKWLPWLLWHLEVPKVNALQSAVVAHLASRHVKVALSGLGGDEIFFGYNIHRYMALAGALKKSFFHPCLRFLGQSASSLLRFSGLAGEEFMRAGQVLAASDIAGAYGILRNVWDSPEGRKRLYGPRLLEAELPSAFDLLHRSWPSGFEDCVEATARFELRQKMVNDLLWNEDRVSMAWGLEVRVPFLDTELVREAASTSRQLLMPGARLKGMLRGIASRWLPAEVLKRPKSGFQVPVHRFFQEHLRELAARYLDSARLGQEGLFNPVFVQQVLSARPGPRLRWHYFILYLMIGVGVWLELFDKNPMSAPEKPTLTC